MDVARMRGRPLASVNPKACLVCGKEFSGKSPALHRRRKYCSVECSNRAPRNPQKTVTQAQLAVIEEFASRGAALPTLAGALGVSKQCYLDIRERDPRVQEAEERGRAQEHDKLVGALFARAIDLENHAGSPAAMFLLKTRHGYRENAEPDNGPRLQIVYQIPAASPIDQFMQRITADKEARAMKVLEAGSADAAPTIDVEVEPA